jgi:hypothetical protein
MSTPAIKRAITKKLEHSTIRQDLVLVGSVLPIFLVPSGEMGSWLLEKWIHHVCRRVFVIFIVDFKVKINKICIQLDTNVFIDLILATQKSTCQFTNTVIFWTELRCSRKSYLNKDTLL